MKPRALQFPFLLRSSALVLLAAAPLQAVPYYWDSNGDTSGYGNTAGTWGTNAFWTSVAGGGATHTGVTNMTTSDVANFGSATLNYSNASVGVALGGVSTTSIVFGAGQTTGLTLTGGAITLGGSTRSVVMNTSSGHTASHAINSPIILTGTTTFQVNDPGSGGGTRQLTLGGEISGTGGVTFRQGGTGSNALSLFILNGTSSYSGNTLIESTVTNSNTEVRLGVNNALPTTTIVTIGGVAGTGTAPGRETQLNLNGKNQTLAGLTTTGGGSLRTQNVFSASAATLTINDSGSRTFGGLIGNGGTNVSIVKQGAGNWTLSGANTYVGTTNIEAGTITISHATALGGASGNTVVGSGARLFVGTSSLSIAEPLNIAGAGISGGNGAIHIGGSATGVAFTGAITLSGNSTIQSDGGTGTTFSGGIDTAGNALSFNGTGTASVNTSGISGIGGSVIKGSGGILNLNVANSYTGLTTVNGGAVVVGHADALGTTAAGTVVNGTGTGSANNARLDVSGGVTVTGESLTINGVGNFTGALTSTSGNNVWAGNVTIGSAGTRIGASAGASIEVSGVIDSGANAFGPVIRTTDLTGTVIFSGANTYLGDTQVLIGKLQLAGGDNRLPVGTNLILSSSSTNPDAEFDLNGRNQEVAGLSMTGTASKNSINNSSGALVLSTLTVNTAASSPSTYGGILKGNLALTKTGADTLTLTGTDNTYTGATNVNQGTLIVDGNISTSVLTTVSDTATLGGGGAVGGLVFQGGSFFDIFDAVDNADPLASTTIAFSTTGFGIDNLVSQGLAVDWSSIANGTYTLITGTLDNTNLGNFGLVNAYDIGGGRSAYFQSGSLQLVVIPEPRAALLGGIGFLLILRRRRA